MAQPHSLPHAERLRSMGAIRALFEQGEGGFVYPIRYIIRSSEREKNPLHSTLFSVPKRFHRRANKRNILRRRLKEAYRLNKELLPEDKSLDIALIYSTKSIHSYKTIENALLKIFAAIKNN